ncbi:hypothetical protein D0T24_05680 [Duganella sp. BJB480]|nr:hypothetical protein D0T26_15580 [Duganella sp. BJB489]RFP37480.1 hypothetical protein D0T24_05680 [Duganella sp. BJB480]
MRHGVVTTILQTKKRTKLQAKLLQLMAARSFRQGRRSFSTSPIGLLTPIRTMMQRHGTTWFAVHCQKRAVPEA